LNWLPGSAGLESRSLWFAYLRRKLLRAGYTDLTTPIVAVHQALLAAEQRVDAAELEAQEAVADRDFVDDTVSDTVRDARAVLGGRSRDAARRPPYILVFPKGVSEYIEADLGDQPRQYEKLVGNLEAFLPVTDPVRVGTVPALRTQLQTRQGAETAVDRARNARDRARVARDQARAAWDEAMVTTYGALLQRVGKGAAARFFPRKGRPSKKVAVKPAPEPEPDPEPSSSD